MADVWQIVGECIDEDRDYLRFIQYQVTHRTSIRPYFGALEEPKDVLEYSFDHIKKVGGLDHFNALDVIPQLKKEVLRKRDLTDLELAIWPADLTTGYVYFLKADNGMVKIGKANSVDDRIKQVKPNLPYELEVIHRINSNVPLKLESVFHQFFAGKRKKGEWFELSEEDIEAVKQIGSFFDYDDEDKDVIEASLVARIGRPRR